MSALERLEIPASCGPRYVRAVSLDVLDSIAGGTATAGAIAADTGRDVTDVYRALGCLRRRALIASAGRAKQGRRGPARRRSAVTPLGAAVLHSRGAQLQGAQATKEGTPC